MKNTKINLFNGLLFLLILGSSGCTQDQKNFCFPILGECNQSGIDNNSRFNSNSDSNNTSSPENFIKWHFDLCNSGDYDTAWNNLSTRFQNKAGGYSEFKSFWQNIDHVNVKSVSIINESNTSAETSVSLQFTRNNGKVFSQKVTYTLVWDSNLEQWIFG